MVLLFPGLALSGETMDDLVQTDGLYYKKFTEVPFTGTVTGRSKGKIKNGKRDGPWVSYWRNGQLWEKGTYKDGKKEGLWVGFTPDGKLNKKWTGTFKNGKKVK